jgi:hypothetical protein
MNFIGIYKVPEGIKMVLLATAFILPFTMIKLGTMTEDMAARYDCRP